MTTRERRRRSTLMLAVTAAVLLFTTGVGCGGDDDESDSSTNPELATVTGTFGNARAESEKSAQERQPELDLPAASGVAANQLRVGDVQTIDQWMSAILQDVHTYWTNLFSANGYPLPGVNYQWVAPGEQGVSSCDPPEVSDRSAFYCPADDTIYIGQATAQEFWSGNLPIGQWDSGDFSVAYVIAHEYGHNVQEELRKPQERAATRELQADCFAGNWGSSAYYSGILEGGDLEEGVRTAAFIGDRGVTDDPHGSPQERADAFLYGYNTADPRKCDAYFP